MNSLLDRVFALCGLSLLLAAVWMSQLAQAQEEVPAPPPVGGRVEFGDHPVFSKLPLAPGYLHRVVANENGDIIIRLTRLPHPGDLFEKAPIGPTCCDELLAHYGSGPMIVEHPLTHITARFAKLGCACTAAGECHCANANCGEDCAGACCKCCPCAAEAAVVAEAKCGEAGCGSDCEVQTLAMHHAEQEVEDELAAEYHPLKLMRHIAGLVGEKAAAQAALAVHKEANDQIGEMMEAMAELLADNAALDAKLEAQNVSHAEQRKLLERVTDLAAENARLKAHVELAAERAELARNSAAVTLENERLKLRVAELEQKQALAEAARTAAKPKDRKAR